MKTKEEIEKLAEVFYPPTTTDLICSPQLVRDAYVMGYQHGQDENNTSKVTRVEVVDETGRVYSKWDCSVELSYQDDGRTLKVFIKPLNKQD